MDIYIKAAKRISIYNRQAIRVADVAEVFAPEQVAEEINALELRRVSAEEPQNILLSIIDIIKCIARQYPQAQIRSVGEPEVLVHFEKKQKHASKLWQAVKIGIVCLILLGGSATAIMSFHTDAQIPTIFRNFYYIFFRETSESMALIDIPYSIGLAAGIILFFNHFSRKQAVSDPTPIDVEMSVYEEDIANTMKDKISQSKTTIGKEQE